MWFIGVLGAGNIILFEKANVVTTIHPKPERPEIAPLFIPKTKIGAQLSIACNVITGSKPITFVWRKNNEVLGDAAIEYYSKGTSIDISNVTINDRGSYSCTAKNSFGEDTKSAELRLSGELSDIEFMFPGT